MKISDKYAWAYGCVNCTYGVKDQYYQPPIGTVELVLERLITAEEIGPDYFCDCECGQHLRAHLLMVRERYNAMLSRHEGQDVAIGKVILAAARVAMHQPHVQFVRIPRDSGGQEVPTNKVTP